MVSASAGLLIREFIRILEQTDRGGFLNRQRGINKYLVKEILWLGYEERPEAARFLKEVPV